MTFSRDTTTEAAVAKRINQFRKLFPTPVAKTIFKAQPKMFTYALCHLFPTWALALVMTHRAPSIAAAARQFASASPLSLVAQCPLHPRFTRVGRVQSPLFPGAGPNTNPEGVRPW